MNAIQLCNYLQINFPVDAKSLSQRKLVCGVGINDSDYKVNPKVNGKGVPCLIYRSWKAMIERTNSLKYQGKQPTYIGVTVCHEWLLFSEFKKWFYDNYVDGWHLDKDLLADSREYGPGTCIFVPRWLNAFTIDSGAARGEWPIGVCFDKHRGMFMAQCRNPITNTNETLGRFSSPERAHRAWLDRKIELAFMLKDLMDAIDKRIYFRVAQVIFDAK